jgi:hypothetical protein
MWFDINWFKFGGEMLPTKWRDSTTIAFIKVLLKLINQVYYSWYNWRIENLYKLEHTGQICSLRGSLNDEFDKLQRRIYIGNGQQKPTTYIYTEAEAQDVFTNTESESKQGTMYVYTEAETADTGLDFIVYVPFEILNREIYALKAHIEFYKAGGKRYAIIGI